MSSSRKTACSSVDRSVKAHPMVKVSALPSFPRWKSSWETR
ncbi:hypothetical protein ACWGOT_32535 [[Kitasatospora] papulosa]